MKLKTIKKRKYLDKTLERTASAYAGAFKILKLLERTQGSENVTNVVANTDALYILQRVKGNF